MPFSSQTEAKQFLVELIAVEAQREGEPLPEIERRLLLFSVDEPESAEEYPRSVFWMMMTSSKGEWSDGSNPHSEMLMKNSRKKIPEAIRELKKGDHYILVMTDVANTGPILTSLTRLRDMVLYIAIGAGVLALSVIYVLYK
ncbi:MAG TPA: hypothetical protein VFW31_11120 [Candidatus Angelobacter sp.]|nr:hypothetical protein [Candidatus Angelobacter sp.]